MVDLQVCLKRQLIACDRKGFFFPVQLAGARTIAKAGLLQIEGKLGRLVQIPIQAHAPGFGGGRVGFGAIDKVDEGIFVDIVFLIARNDFPRTEAAVGVERAFLAALGGTCHSPVAALATISNCNASQPLAQPTRTG